MKPPTPPKILVSGKTYIRKDYMLRYLRKERRIIRSHLKDRDWGPEWTELKVCESLYNEIIYILNKHT